MKVFLAFALWFGYLVGLGQNIEIESNVDQTSRDDSYVLHALTEEYDLLIAYTEECYWWSNQINYRVFAKQNEKWFFFAVSAHRPKNKTEFSKPTVRKKRVNADKVNALLNDWNDISFLNLDNDSLHITAIERTLPTDSTIKIKEVHFLSDGVNFRFEIITPTQYRIIEAYEPAYFLKEIPEIKLRQTFITGSKAFKLLLQETCAK